MLFLFFYDHDNRTLTPLPTRQNCKKKKGYVNSESGGDDDEWMDDELREGE